MLTLVPVLTRFLEAASTASKWRSIAPIEKQLEKDMRQAFTIQGKKFLDGFAANRGKFEEALSPNDWIGIWDEVAQQTLQFFIDPIQQAVQLSMSSAAEQLVGELEVDYSFSLKNPRAVQYVEDHGAELVKGINDTTRDYLRTVITQGTDEGWSYDQMAKAITRRFADFAVGRPQEHIDSRAHLVAVTEVGNAYEHGNMIVAQDLKAAGLKMEKKWSTMGDARVDPHCLANERQGWIPVDDAFSDGSMQPLSHPACRCTALYRRMQDAAIPKALQPEPPAAQPYDLSDGTRVRNEFTEEIKNVDTKRQKLVDQTEKLTNQIEALIAKQQKAMAAAPGGWSDEIYAQYKAKITPLQDKRGKVYDSIDDLNREQYDILADIAAVDRKKQQQFSLEYTGDLQFDRSFGFRARNAQGFIEKITAGEGNVIDVRVDENTSGRAFALPGSISVDKNESTSIIAHELGHNLEYIRGAEARAKRIAFFDKRTVGDPIEKLVDAHPGSGYADHEIFKRDKWMNNYMGRIYSHDSDTRASSEIITMGIQYLMERPLQFAEKDPEYFDFIVGYLRGTL